MSTKRVLLVVLVASGVMLAVGGDAVRALPREPVADEGGRTPAAPSALAALSVTDQIQILSDVGYDLAVAYNSVHDEYLVVWGTPYEVRAQCISGRGELVGSEFYVAQGSNEQEADPAVAYDFVNNRYLVVWLVERPLNFRYIRGRFIRWNGPDPNWVEFDIRWTSSLWWGPEVAYARAQEEFLVVWQSGYGHCPPTTDCTQVWGCRVYANDPTGDFPDSAFHIAGSCPVPRRRSPDVAYNLARNEYLVTYDDCSDIYGKRLTGNGTELGGGEFQITWWPDDELFPFRGSIAPDRASRGERRCRNRATTGGADHRRRKGRSTQWTDRH
ncbi:MAG: hypothetical protein IMY86_13675 [Chloroflexi bacterium]|nr:hypothetical protein [Chloroflexota bacterium]